MVANGLAAHPELTVSPETHYLTYWRKWYPSDDPVSGELLERLFASKRFSYLGVAREDVESRFASAGGRTHRSLFTAMMDAYASMMGRRRWGEKTPDHFRWIGTLLEWFPRARMIFVVRDPRAMAASLRRVPWGRDDAASHADLWTRAIEQLERWLPDERVTYVRYCDYVCSPAEEAERLCSHIGERFDERVLRPTASDVPIFGREGEAWAKGHLERALSPPTASSLNGWRESLPASHVAEVEHRIGEERLRAWGFEPRDRPGRASVAVRVAFKDGAARLRSAARRVSPRRPARTIPEPP